MRKNYGILFVLIFLFTGISYSQIPDGLLPLMGKWVSESNYGNIYEEWELYSEYKMKGKDYRISDSKGYEILEELTIEQIEDNIYYTAIVSDQNMRKPVRFKLIDMTSNVFIFENKNHDFPQRIIYNIQDTEIITASIEGETPNGFKSIRYIFKRTR